MGFPTKVKGETNNQVGDRIFYFYLQNSINQKGETEMLKRCLGVFFLAALFSTVTMFVVPTQTVDAGPKKITLYKTYRRTIAQDGSICSSRLVASDVDKDESLWHKWFGGHPHETQYETVTTYRDTHLNKPTCW